MWRIGRGGMVSIDVARGSVEKPFQFGFSLVFVVVLRVIIVVGADFCYLVVDGRFGERGRREVVSESVIENKKARATASENGPDMWVHSGYCFFICVGYCSSCLIGSRGCFHGIIDELASHIG
jgi:hypothetical protein